MIQSGSTSILLQTVVGLSTWRSSRLLRMGHWERMNLCRLSFSRRANRHSVVGGRMKASEAGRAKYRR